MVMRTPWKDPRLTIILIFVAGSLLGTVMGWLFGFRTLVGCVIGITTSAMVVGGCIVGCVVEEKVRRWL